MSRSIIPLAIMASLMVVSPAMSHDNEIKPMISVVGEGVTHLRPDLAIVSLSVMKESETAREALDANNADMAAILAALKEEGIDMRDLQTSGLSINPQYIYPNDKNGEPKARIVGYQVTNALTVRVRDLSKLGGVLDRSVSLGVNQGGNIVFTNDNPADALNEARKKAVEDAMAKARILADAAGVSIGKVLKIAENSDRPVPMPMMKAMRMEASMAQDSAVPVEAGENSYSIRVNMMLELVQE